MLHAEYNEKEESVACRRASP